jgi:hypothetical protein
MNEQEWLKEWAKPNPEADWIEFLSEKEASARKFRSSPWRRTGRAGARAGGGRPAS